MSKNDLLRDIKNKREIYEQTLLVRHKKMDSFEIRKQKRENHQTNSHMGPSSIETRHLPLIHRREREINARFLQGLILHDLKRFERTGLNNFYTKKETWLKNSILDRSKVVIAPMSHASFDEPEAMAKSSANISALVSKEKQKILARISKDFEGLFEFDRTRSESMIDTRACARSVLFGDDFYVIGGFGRKSFDEIVRLDLKTGQVKTEKTAFYCKSNQALCQLKEIVLLHGGDDPVPNQNRVDDSITLCYLRKLNSDNAI